MSKTLFIVAGFKHSASEPQYMWMRKFFTAKGFTVQTPDIEWNNKVMSDYVGQFSDYYRKRKTETNYTLGFSFGAMTALISASELKPDRIFLCSLSPYFAEDLETVRPSWKKSLGHRRFADFGTFQAKEIARRTEMPTAIFYGGAEGAKYPQLKKRCEETAAAMKNSKLIVARDAPHEIDFPSYTEVIKSEFA